MNYRPRHAIVLLVFCVIWLANCGGNRARLLEFVPAECNAFINLNWTAVRKDAGLKKIARADLYEAQLEKLGIDGEKVEDLVVFAVMGANGTQGAMLFRGSFDERRILAALKTKGWAETVVEGRKALVNGEDYIAAPAEYILAAGTSEGLAAVFRTAESNRSLSRSESYKKLRKPLSENKSPVTAMLIAPDGTIEAVDAALDVTDRILSVFDLGEFGSLLKMLNIAGGAGYTIARGQDGKYAVGLSVLMRDEKTAKIIVGSLNILKTLSGAVSAEKDRETTEALRDFRVLRDENVVSLNMQMPEDSLLPKQ